MTGQEINEKNIRKSKHWVKQPRTMTESNYSSDTHLTVFVACVWLSTHTTLKWPMGK